MAEPKALKILKNTPEKTDKMYIFHKGNSTYIEVPNTVNKTLTKINSLNNQIGYVAMNLLATAINKRNLKDITGHIDSWESSALKTSFYPNCDENTAFDKLLSTFFQYICPGEIKDSDLNNLIHFFAKCPHGYDVSNLIKCSNELKPVTT